MTFEDAIKSSFNGYLKFKGRSCRAEFWLWVLFIFLGFIVAAGIDSFLDGTGATDAEPLKGLFVLAILLPSISVSIRRLHDVGRSGWWFLLSLALLIGWAVLIYWFVSKGADGPNEFGKNPLGDESTAAADVSE